MKALVLFSGGLDSILAAKLLLEQGIKVYAVNFTSPFYQDSHAAEKAAKQLEIPLKTIALGNDFLKIIKKPRYGCGANINPCIDCRILMLKKAKKYAEKINAKFIATGEVLGERPMTQLKNSLKLIEKKAGLKGKLLRPLSAKLLPETQAEKKGYVNREKLLAIQGRSRKPQISLAKKYRIRYFPTPAGGCLLTQKEFAAKLRDLFKHKKKTSMKDIPLLRIGRHFRYHENKIIVGRNQQENQKLLKLKKPSDYIFEVPNIGSPITMLQGKKTRSAVKKAAQLTARYSDAEEKTIKVSYGKEKLNKSIKIPYPEDTEIQKMRV
jgi:tRNA-specific 2-thiouridylase